MPDQPTQYTNQGSTLHASTLRFRLLHASLTHCSAGCHGMVAAVWSHTSAETGICWPSVATLGEYVGVSQRQARRMLAELVEAGVLVAALEKRDTTTYSWPDMDEVLDWMDAHDEGEDCGSTTSEAGLHALHQ